MLLFAIPQSLQLPEHLCYQSLCPRGKIGNESAHTGGGCACVQIYQHQVDKRMAKKNLTKGNKHYNLCLKRLCCE